jgi:A/G-specific adenine glycosylase
VTDGVARKRRRRGGPAAALLAWYDANARALPWRVGPLERARGEWPDPWAVLLSEVMLQQTTVAAVAPRYAAFLKRWPAPAALAATPLDDLLSAWAGLGYYARARNLHRCAAAIARDHGGVVPGTEEALRALPGVGPYTAAAVAAIAFDAPAVVVDGNVERVVARLFAVAAPLPGARPEIRARAGEIWPAARSGDFAQGLMDLGARVCTPRSPNCPVCPLAGDCRAGAAGAAETYPRRSARAARPTRFGWALARFDGTGRVLLERRPEAGLLGGMLGLPGSQWREDAHALPPPPRDAVRAGAVAHAFTHFRLELDVHVAPARRAKAHETWAEIATVRLPTVMRKALDRARAAQERSPLAAGDGSPAS